MQSPDLDIKPTKSRVLHTNAGLKSQYTRLLIKIVRELSTEVATAIKEQYRQDESQIVGDDSPVSRLQSLLTAARERFAARIEFTAPRLAQWFVERVRNGVNKAQKESFMAAGLQGFTVSFETGTLTQSVVESLVSENVNLIKSIGSQYLTDVEGIVMRGVQSGRDLKQISTELKKRYDITARRAAMIARDQANKATQGISRANCLDAGISRAEWIHIPGRKSERRVHRSWNGKQFDLSKGLYNPETNQWELPGQPICCNCSFRLVVDKKLWKDLTNNS
jgi:hypothetical protein